LNYTSADTYPLQIIKFKIQSEVSSACRETKYVHSEKQIELRISTIKVMYMWYYIPPKQKMGSEPSANNITVIKYTDNLKKGKCHNAISRGFSAMKQVHLHTESR